MHLIPYMLDKSLLATLLILIAACGGTPETSDETNSQQECDPYNVLPTSYQPVDLVSSRSTTSEIVEDHNELAVDATAGGLNNAALEPFVYLRFSNDTTAEKISISDPDSFDSTDWDIAFKRYVVRINSGDSGTGNVTVARVQADSLAEVTEIPSSFLADDWATETCALVTDQIGGPLTAIGEWYIPSPGTLTPKNEVYVLRLADDNYVKLRILNYYGDANNPTRGANYQIAWAPL